MKGNENRYPDCTGSKNVTYRGEVAQTLGIQEDELELYGKYKAKLSDEAWNNVKDRPDGKLVLVTAINPTPAGEGKTTTTVGLGQAMAKIK